MALTSPAFPVPCGPRASQRVEPVRHLGNCCLPHGEVGVLWLMFPSLTFASSGLLCACLICKQIKSPGRQVPGWIPEQQGSRPLSICRAQLQTLLSTGGRSPSPTVLGAGPWALHMQTTSSSAQIDVADWQFNSTSPCDVPVRPQQSHMWSLIGSALRNQEKILRTRVASFRKRHHGNRIP